ncbi:MAG TPA: TetR/AcrR family transcriptional regulator [Chitinophagaceae bacterium]|nr:TetR/AcrR family transcriptional regulator [Chitinophagaceae bacterium]
MVKAEKDHSTERRILEAAKKVFVRKGLSGARMQDIADEAGINKALLHYYFHNKRQLFEMIFQEAAGRLFPKINEVFDADLPLFDKIERFCSEYISIIQENPYLPLFVLNEISQDPDYFLKKVWNGESRPRPEKLIAQIQEAISRGVIRPVRPLHLLLHLLSMTLFPFVARPMLARNLGVNEEQFYQLMEERKREIPAFLISAIRL